MSGEGRARSRLGGAEVGARETLPRVGAVRPRALRAIPLFAGLPAASLDALAESLSPVAAPANQVIVCEGDVAEAMYVIASGRAKVTLYHRAGREVILSVLGEGDFFGEMSLFDSAPRSATVQAIEDCRLLRLGKKEFLALLARHHEVAMTLMGGLIARLREANDKIESLAVIDVKGRVARLLLDESRLVNGRTQVPRRLSRAEIARMVGASREMVSRVMTSLEKAGQIRSEGGIIYLSNTGSFPSGRAASGGGR
jgi:CRP/FNR family cyclic AMP-dependent transcriptional regulator